MATTKRQTKAVSDFRRYVRRLETDPAYAEREVARLERLREAAEAAEPLQPGEEEFLFILMNEIGTSPHGAAKRAGYSGQTGYQILKRPRVAAKVAFLDALRRAHYAATFVEGEGQ